MAGGFKFGSDSVTYDSTTYTTKSDWALAVHKARCLAFILATIKESQDGNHPWTCPSEQGGSVETVQIRGRIFASYRMISAHLGDNEANYPAYITYFKNPNSSAEYCIITSNGFHGNSSYASNYTYGLYVNPAKLARSGTAGNRYYPMNLAHAFALNGFGSYDVGSSSIEPGELSVTNCFNTDQNQSYSVTGSSKTANKNDGMIYNPTSGRTYTFGYAVKENMIEAFYRASNYESNAGWMWCIIGEIFDNTCLVNTYPVGSYKPYRGSIAETSELRLSTTTDYANYSACEVIGAGGIQFPVDTMNYFTTVPVLMPSFLPNRCDSNTPGKLIYAAACLGFGGASYGITLTIAGIDGLGNCVKGYIKTDLLRMVSFLATKIGGTTYQGGNFVVPCNCGAVQNNMDFGIILGWDADNESIL